MKKSWKVRFVILTWAGPAFGSWPGSCTKVPVPNDTRVKTKGSVGKVRCWDIGCVWRHMMGLAIDTISSTWHCCNCVILWVLECATHRFLISSVRSIVRIHIIRWRMSKTQTIWCCRVLWRGWWKVEQVWACLWVATRWHWRDSTKWSSRTCMRACGSWWSKRAGTPGWVGVAALHGTQSLSTLEPLNGWCVEMRSANLPTCYPCCRK